MRAGAGEIGPLLAQTQRMRSREIGNRTLGFELKVMIGRRRLEFGGTQGGMELEEPLVNSFFFRTSLACTQGKPSYKTISASFSILPVIAILSSNV